MSEVKWIKIVTDIFDDEKILLIESLPDSETLIVIWFKLLCLAGKQNNSGVFLMNNRIPYTDEMLASIFRRPLNVVRMALNTFESFGMIEIVDGVITIPNWEKHQSLDKLEMIKEQTRLRVAKHREKQKQKALGLPETTEEETCNVTDTLLYANVTQTDIEKDKDKDKDIDKEIDLDIDKEKDIKKKKTKDTVSIPYEYGMDTTDTDTVADTVSDDDTVSEIINYLNNKLNSKYRVKNKVTQKHIKARLKEGFTIDDFKVVIDKKYNEWFNDDRMRQYLRPETLFGTKFESYLNAPEKQKTSGNEFFDLLRREGKM